jgi:3-methyladenine DNA glycosylase Mpg
MLYVHVYVYLDARFLSEFVVGIPGNDKAVLLRATSGCKTYP